MRWKEITAQILFHNWISPFIKEGKENVEVSAAASISPFFIQEKLCTYFGIGSQSVILGI